MATAASSSEVSVFDNGLPIGRTDWLRDGVLAHLRYHRAGAARSGVEWRPTSTTWCCAATGQDGGSVDDMVARTERGLLLTCLWYIREVDPATLLMTGLTRDGVYLVENGDVVGAANNFRFNESPVDLLARATEVGTPVRALGPRVRRVPQPDGHAAAAHPRLQHELGEPGQLSARSARSDLSAGRRRLDEQPLRRRDEGAVAARCARACGGAARRRPRP